MRRRLPLPRGMIGRIALVLVVALAVEFAGVSLIHVLDERNLVTEDRTRRVAEQLVVAQRVAHAVTPERRAALMRGLSIGGMTLNWVGDTVITDASPSRASLARMRERLREASPALAARDLRMNLLPSDRGGTSDLFGALRLDDGSFVTFRVSPFLGSPPGFAVTLLMHLALVGGVLLVTVAMVNALVRPLTNLADAADRTGRGSAVDIPVEGPLEVQRVAAAFAAMQARLLAVVDDNTQALVAVSHDLRTPIQRLRLRASLLEDETAAQAMAADLDDIERFVDSVLAFLRGDNEEVLQLVDVAALAMTAVDNAADTGGAVVYAGPDSLVAETRPLAVKRMLGNLLDNGLRHGGQVRLTLATDDSAIRFTIEDDGPGIPEDQRALALLPFRRLEGSRRSGSGGAGLGLAIVQRIARTLAGELSLGRSGLGGLSATIALPRGGGRA